MSITEVRIYPTKGEGAVKAFASVTLGGYAVHGVKIIDSDKGLFVAMPSEAREKDGKKEYKDIFHPVSPEARKELVDAVMDAYNAAAK